MLSMPPGGYSKTQLDKEINAGNEKLTEFCKIPQGIEHEYSIWEGTQPSSDILKIAHENRPISS